MTDRFVVNLEHKRFCRHQYVGFPPEKDCMDDYIKEKKNAKTLQEEKEGSLWTQQKVSLQNKEEKEKVLTDKTTAIKKLEELKQFLNKKKQASFQK
tara:strand:- start:202 stop:489 length:288 start_codon:yes stop_codon:yes gene_type:complete